MRLKNMEDAKATLAAAADKKRAQFDVEENVPMPIFARPATFPFAKMKVGQSFFVEATPEEFKRKRGTVSAAWKKYQRSGNEDAKFISRVVEGGFRVWRVS